MARSLGRVAPMTLSRNFLIVLGSPSSRQSPERCCSPSIRLMYSVLCFGCPSWLVRLCIFSCTAGIEEVGAITTADSGEPDAHQEFGSPVLVNPSGAFRNHPRSLSAAIFFSSGLRCSRRTSAT